jgi:hypothetical protein
VTVVFEILAGYTKAVAVVAEARVSYVVVDGCMLVAQAAVVASEVSVEGM